MLGFKVTCLGAKMTRGRHTELAFIINLTLFVNTQEKLRGACVRGCFQGCLAETGRATGKVGSTISETGGLSVSQTEQKENEKEEFQQSSLPASDSKHGDHLPPDPVVPARAPLDIMPSPS